MLRRVDVVTLPGGHLPHVTSSLAFARAARDFVLFNGDDAAMTALRDSSEASWGKKFAAEKWKEDDGEGQIITDDQRRALTRRYLVMGRRLIA